VTRLGELDRRQVRAAYERRFTPEAMALNYLRLYWRLYRGLEGMPAPQRGRVAAATGHALPAVAAAAALPAAAARAATVRGTRVRAAGVS
jgi:hypothetical protein